MIDNIIKNIDDFNKLNNPIVIYGEEKKLEKCMNDIKKYITKSNKSVLYVTGNEFISNIGKNTVDNVDIFILDDIAKLEKHITSQHELFYIFNKLYDDKKRIIISTSKTPDNLQDFEERLITRLEWSKIYNI